MGHSFEHIVNITFYDFNITLYLHDTKGTLDGLAKPEKVSNEKQYYLSVRAQH